MTDLEKNELFTDCYELLDIFKENCPIQDNGTFVYEAIKPCYMEMLDYVFKDDQEELGIKDFFRTRPDTKSAALTSLNVD